MKKEKVVLENREIEVPSEDNIDSIEQFRDEREEMLLEEDVGALSLTRDFNDSNYVLYTARLNKPGWIRTLQKMGYEFVSEDELESGKLRDKDSLGKNKVSIDSAARVELGINHGSDPGVVMKCPREVYEKRQKARAKVNSDAIKHIRPQDSNIEGTITIDGKKY